MKKHNGLRIIYQGFLFSLISIFLGNLTAQAGGAFNPVNLNETIKSGQHSQKVDNFLVILDASGSMTKTYRGTGLTGSKFEVSKEILNRLNQTIPDLSLNSGLRSFGFTSCLSWNWTVLNYGMSKYNKTDFNTGLNSQACASGGSFMGAALDEAVSDLESSQGEIAVLIASDGYPDREGALPYAQNLKNQYGSRLCIYTIWVGNLESGKQLMQQLADAGECGFAVAAQDIASPDAMGKFVDRIFLHQNLDKDGDGVVDKLDQCPNTPRGVKVDAVGCPLDSDGDGVADYLDKCPRTPRGITVNEVGCWVGGKVLFDFDKDIIKPETYPLLDELAGHLKKSDASGVQIEIDGHTDSVGAPAYNMDLSKRRANAIRDYLIKQGVEPNKLIGKGFGSTQPLYPNDSEANRAKNRRVQLKTIPYK